MGFKGIIIGKKFFIEKQICFFLLAISFVMPVYGEDKAGSKEKEGIQSSEIKVNSESGQVGKDIQKKISEFSEEKSLKEEKLKNATREASTDDTFLTSQIDANKVMEQTLQETMINELKAYYPMIRGIRFEADEAALVMEIDYEQSSEKEILNIQTNLVKGQMHAEITLKSPLLQKKEDVKIEGDHQLVESVSLTPNLSLSSKLGNDAKLFFVNQIQFQLLRPVRWKMEQTPGLLRIEIKPYLASDQETQGKKTEDLLFQAPPLQTTAPILGESFTREREYEKNVVSGGQPTLLESLEAETPSPLAHREASDYSYGLSEADVRQDIKARYPTFGTLEYWKKNLSGVILNTLRFTKRQRNQAPFLSEDPAIAFVFDRKGAAHVRMGYNAQREFPFFYGKKGGGLAPMDGFMRHDFQGGIVFKTESPWLYSIQNQYSISSSENLSEPPKFGDRISTYQYVAGQGLRYNFKRGYAQWGSGLLWKTEERGINEDVTGYLSALWSRPWTKKIATRFEYNYERTFLHDPKPIIDANVHKMYLGLELKPDKNITLTPTLGWSFYDGESFVGLLGGFKYQHQMSARDSMTISYSTDFIKSQTNHFGVESLASTRSTFNSNGALIRYQTLSAEFTHRLTKSMSFILSGSYRRERQFEKNDNNRLDEYRISAGLSHKMTRAWNLELRYNLIYLNAYQGLENDIGNITRHDSGNTEHSLDLRMLRYFGETGR